jgi:chemotaxis protein MotB
VSDGEKITIIRKVNKKGGHGGHHGGAWKVAYADFVTAMMALFIVLWIVANNVTVRASVADYFRDPGAMSKTASGVMNGSNSMKPFSDAQPTQRLVAPDQPPQPSGTASAPQQAEVEKLRQEGERLMQMIAAIPDLSKFKDQIEIKITKDGLRIELIEQAEGLFFDIQRPAQAGCHAAAQADRHPHRHLPERRRHRRPHRQPALHSGRVQQLGPQHRPRQLRTPGD